jgi:hypothetical protein
MNVESYACIDCGQVWMQTSPKILEDFSVSIVTKRLID